MRSRIAYSVKIDLDEQELLCLLGEELYSRIITQLNLSAFKLLALPPEECVEIANRLLTFQLFVPSSAFAITDQDSSRIRAVIRPKNIVHSNLYRLMVNLDIDQERGFTDDFYAKEIAKGVAGNA